MKNKKKRTGVCRDIISEMKAENRFRNIVLAAFFFIVLVIVVITDIYGDNVIVDVVFKTLLVVSIIAVVVYHIIDNVHQKRYKEIEKAKNKEMRMKEDKHLKYEYKIVKELKEKDDKISEISNRLLSLRNEIHDERIKNAVDDIRRKVIFD